MAGNHSGVEVYIKSLLKELFKQDTQNHYILWWNSRSDVSKNIPKFPHQNISYFSTNIPNKLLNFSLSLFKYPKIDRWIGKKIQKRIDLVFIPDPRPTPVSKNCKKITTFHDLSFEHFQQTFSWKTRIWHKLLNPKSEAQTSNQIISVSENTKQDLIKTYQIPAEKIEVIYEASNLNSKIDIQKENEIKIKYNLPEKFILTLSTIEPRKNIAGLLAAFQKLKQENNFPHKLVIAGKKNSKIFSQIEEIKNNNKDIILTGFIEEIDKPYLYKLATAFIYPSFFEGFGLPLVEAMQMGCPIITSNLSSMPEIVKDAALLINPYDINSITEGIQKILSNDKLKAELQKKSLKRANAFDWEKCAKTTLNIFLKK